MTAICAFAPLHDTVTVPLLDDVEALGATTIVSVPVSVADDAPENVIQLAFDEAAHVQLPDVLVTVTLNVPPADVGDCAVDETVNAQGDGVVGVVGVSFLLQAETKAPVKRRMEQMCFIARGSCEFDATNGRRQPLHERLSCITSIHARKMWPEVLGDTDQTSLAGNPETAVTYTFPYDLHSPAYRHTAGDRQRTRPRGNRREVGAESVLYRWRHDVLGQDQKTRSTHRWPGAASYSGVAAIEEFANRLSSLVIVLQVLAGQLDVRCVPTATLTGKEARSMSSKTFKATIFRDGAMCFIPLGFDPKTVFGKVRAPVRVTLNGYTYRSTIAAMGGPPCIPLRKSNREAAGLEGGETIEVKIDLDSEKREIKPPADFVKALKATPPAWERWRELSYSHQREHVESIDQAKKPETRARRIERATHMLRLTRKRETAGRRSREA